MCRTKIHTLLPILPRMGLPYLRHRPEGVVNLGKRQDPREQQGRYGGQGETRYEKGLFREENEDEWGNSKIVHRATTKNNESGGC